MILRPVRPAVADRAADHETTRRVDQEAGAQHTLVIHVRGQSRDDNVLPQIV